jgi:tetratricopeptide (TPR) repeat protein
MKTVKKEKRRKIAHIIQPAIVDKSSDLFVAQPITFETMKIAQKLAQEQVDVTLYYARFFDENISMPEEFQATRDLKRSILDIAAFEHKRKLPLIKDILDRLYEAASEAEYLIYTNVDIALMPHFYITVNQLIEKGYDAFFINRRTISKKYQSVSDIPLMYSEIGKPHGGQDCFVFKRSVYPEYYIGDICIGVPSFGKELVINLLCHATRFEEFKDLHLTFHLGNDRVWNYDENQDYRLHNINELKKIIKYYQESTKLPDHSWVDKIMAKLINPQIPEDKATIGVKNAQIPTKKLDIINSRQLGSMIHEAVAQLNADKNANAFQLLEEVSASLPKLIGLQYGKVLALARLKRTEEAIEILKRLLTAAPSHQQAQLLLDELSQTAKQTKKRVLTPINIYHCCVHKTASQWLKQILADARIYSYSGFQHHHLQTAMPNFGDKPLTERFLTEPFPQKTIVSPLYFSFDNFLTLPKPERYKAFFIMRDPRDLVISFYFSHTYSHSPNPKVLENRKILEKLSLTEGLLFTIEKMNERGHFSVLRSWIEAPEKDPDVLLLRYEDLTAPDNLVTFKKLFSHCQIQIPESVILALLQDYCFEKLSGGRNPGEEDHLSHYRKGIAGDWKNYFNDNISQKFKEVTGNLLTCLGYEAETMSDTQAISTKKFVRSDSNEQSKKLLVFTHIPKTGGGTLSSILSKNYAEDTILPLKYKSFTDVLTELSESQKKQIACCVGHIPFGLHEYFSKPAIYITLLRHPIDRVISLYYFILRQKVHRFHDELIAKQMTLKDFVVSGFEPVLNTQTRILAGLSGSPISRDELNMAKKNLEEHFFAVGTTEKFDDFLLMLQKRLGWKYISYQKKHVTYNRPRTEDIPGDVLKLIKERNELDLELYEFVKNQKW